MLANANIGASPTGWILDKPTAQWAMLLGVLRNLPNQRINVVWSSIWATCNHSISTWIWYCEMVRDIGWQFQCYRWCKQLIELKIRSCESCPVFLRLWLETPQFLHDNLLGKKSWSLAPQHPQYQWLGNRNQPLLNRCLPSLTVSLNIISRS